MESVARSRDRPSTPAAPARASSSRAWPSRSSATLASATSSSSSGAEVTHSVSRWPRTRASSPSMRQYAPRSAGSTPSGTVVSTPASGSSNPVPKAHRASSPWAAVNASYTVSSCITLLVVECQERGNLAPDTPLDVWDVVRDVVERGVAVDLVAARREQGVLLVGARRGDVGRPDHPDADALVA